jgi:hypothetical protein
LESPTAAAFLLLNYPGSEASGSAQERGGSGTRAARRPREENGAGPPDQGAREEKDEDRPAACAAKARRSLAEALPGDEEEHAGGR